ncbi:uncharacterized protein [Henckelia pumila]|uniref:uncharacterized protein n=1 Tax=Henckelia pumila TaxID=405737 RepID=UPI003C6DE036
MDCALNIAPSSVSSLRKASSSNYEVNGRRSSSLIRKMGFENPKNDTVSLSSSSARRTVLRAIGNVHQQRSNLEPLFCYDKPIPEQIIEPPIGLSVVEKNIGDNPRCSICEAKGAALCTTCSGSGLYVDSILESQGIIVKVRCLGCGGTGNTMCSECGGRGHL